MSDTNNSSRVSFKPSKNILDAYDQPSYSLNLYITDDKTGTKRIALIQTGKAPYSIQNLRIESQVGPTKSAKNTTVTNLTMTVKEPMGANLLDTMFAAAQTLGIKNIQEVPYQLVIYFHGYNPNNGNIVSQIDNTTFTYYLKLNNIKTNINNGDVTHQIEFIPYSETALYDCYNVFPNGFSIAIQDGSTFGSIIGSIKDTLNNDFKKIYGNDNIQYDFKFMDYPANDILSNIKNPKDLTVKLSDIKYTSSINAGTIHFSDLSTLISAIETILSSSEDAVTLIAPNAASQTNIIQGNNKKYIKSIAHHIQTQMTIGDYDSSINDYKRTITYIIKPYISYRLFDSKETIQNAYDKETNIKKASDMINNKFLQKKYDYIFTGKNTEVLNLDVNLNFNWGYMIDVNAGTINSYSQTIGKIYKEQDNTNPLNLDSAFTDAVINQTLSSANSPIISLTGNSSTDNIDYTQVLNDTVSYDYLNTILKNTNTANNGYLPLKIQSQFRKDYNEYQYNVVNDGSGNKTLYSFLINQLQVENGYQDGLQQLTMTIKGDPFWLGTPDDISDYVKTIKGNSISSNTDTIQTNDTLPYKVVDNYANYTVGENCFVLSFVLPNGYNDENMTVNLNKSNLYSGIYSVLTVTSEFSNGDFRQMITAFKINGLIPNEILNIKE